MPLIPINYSNTHFYKIVSNDLTIKDCYVGHTTNYIDRKARHKIHCNNSIHKHHYCKLYVFIRDNGGWDNFNMVLIEVVPCANVL